jgi:hypothetical protein
MNRPIDAERILDDFLAPSPDRLPQRVFETAFAEIAKTPQRRGLRLPRAFPASRGLAQLAQLATLALVVVIAAGGALYALDFGGAGGGPISPPSVSPSPSPVATSTLRPIPQASPLPTFRPDLRAWTQYASSAYGYEMAYPKAWTVDHFDTRRWDAATDGLDPRSPGVDTFVNAAGKVTVSRWRAPHDPNGPVGDPAWVELLCRAVGDEPCDGIAQRAVSICTSNCDNNPIVVPFRDHVMAFYLGTPDDTVNVVAVWLPETDPAFAEYGGAANLLRAFVEHG